MSEQSMHNLGINITVNDQASQRLESFERSINSLNSRIKTINQNMSRVGKTTQDAMGNASTGTQNLNQRISELNQNQQNLSNQVSKNQQLIDKNTNAINNFGGAIKETNEQTVNWLSSYTQSLSIAVRSVAIWGVATTAIYGTKRALEDAHQVLRDVNSEMVALQRVMNRSITDFEEMESAAARLGVEFATSIDEVVRSMVGWARQGQEQIEVIELTEAALLASNVAQMDAARSVELLTSAILQFNLRAGEAVEVVDRLNEVANNYAVTAEDLAMAIRETGAAANSAGVSIDEVIGITAALSAATAKTGNRIGRTLRTVFSRMMGDAQGVGESLGQVELALNQVGVALRRSETEYRDLMDVLTDLAIVWDDLDTVMQANIARAMGGRRQYSDVISLMENWDMALEATETSMDSLNSAIEENLIYMESIDAQWQQARSQFEQLALTLGDLMLEDLSLRIANAFQSLIITVERLAIGLSYLQERFALVSTVMAGLSATALFKIGMALTAISAPVALVIGSIVTLTTTIGLVANALGKKEQKLEEVSRRQEQLNTLSERSNELSLIELSNTQDTVRHYEDLIDSYVRLQNEIEALQLSELMSDMASDAADLFDIPVLGRFYSVLDSIGISMGEAVELFSQNNEVVNELKEEHEDLADQYDTDIEFIEALIEKYNEYNDTVESSISWISKYGVERLKNVQQGRREALMLENTAGRFNELANAEGRTLEQSLELRQIMNDLEGEFFELAKTGGNLDNFKKALEDVVGDTVEDLRDFEFEVDLARKEIEQLEKAEDDLVVRKKELTENLKTQLKNLEELNDEYGKHSTEVREATEYLQELRNDYENVSEQIEESIETQIILNSLLKELSEDIEDIDTAHLISQITKANNVLNSFLEELINTQIQLEDFERELQADVAFIEWKVDILGLSELERLDLLIDNLEGAESDLIGIRRELNQLEVKPESAQTAQELISALGEFEGIEVESLEISAEELLENWDEELFEQLLAEIFSDIDSKLLETISRREDLEMQEMFTELLTVDTSQIPELDDSIIQEYSGFIQMIRELGEEDLDRLMKELDVEFSDELVKNVDILVALRKEFEKELVSRPYLNSLEDLYDGLNRVSDFELMELEIVDEDLASENVKRAEDAINNIVTAVEIDFDIDIDSKELQDLNDLLPNLEDKFENTGEIIGYLESQLQKVDDLDTKEMLRGIIEELELTEEQYKSLIETLEDEVRIREIKNEVYLKELELMEDNERQVILLSDEIQRFNELQEETADEELSNRIQKITENLEDQKRVLQALNTATTTQELGIIDTPDFDINDLGFREALEISRSIERSFQESRETVRAIGDRFDLTGDQVEELMKEFELDEESYQQMVEDLDSRMSQIANNFANNLVRGAEVGLARLEDKEDFGVAEAFAETFGHALLAVLSDQDTMASLVDMTGIEDRFGENIANAVTYGFSSALDGLFDEGTSTGRALTTGLGAGIGAVFGMPQVGAAIGDMVGGVGEAIFGGNEGVEEKEAAEEINEQIDQASERMAEFGTGMDYVKASMEETTGFMQGLFGGESWDVTGLEDAEESLERMEQIIGRLESTFNELGNELASSIKSSFTYQDMHRSFTESVGQALLDSVIEAFIEAELIEDQLKELSTVVVDAAQDGIITEQDISEIGRRVSAITAEAEGIRPAIEAIQSGMGIGVDGRRSQSFQAGSTSSISYNNQFIVKSQAFAGSKGEAKMFAKLIAPYVKEELDRQTGN